jgi:drug/metabolite transporter (DMT)-like permease
MWGNLLMLLALVGEAAYSVMGRTLIKRHTPVSVFGVAILSGVSFLTVATYLIHGSLPLNFAAHIDKKALLALLWLGPFGTTASYIFWMFALRQAPVASIALTLFIQPVFGAVWGYFILNERLSATQFAGGAMILLAVFAQTLVELFSGRGRKKPVA